jgi:hypothetical protein
MRKNLSALMTGIVMLSGAGIAQAADVTQTNTQSKTTPASMTMPAAQSEVATTTSNPQDRKLVALTDEQMSGVTAGNYLGYYHYNYIWINGYFYRTYNHY